MNRADSWSCLTVEQFLHLCNWEGKQKERNWEQEKPIFQISWQCEKVEDFFSQFNWSGQVQERHNPANLIPVVPRLTAIATKETSLKRLLVKEFFTQCNWQGRTTDANRILDQLDPYTRLKQSVSEFFGFISWEGEPEIGTLPKSTTTFVQPTVTSPKFIDLTDLF